MKTNCKNKIKKREDPNVISCNGRSKRREQYLIQILWTKSRFKL